MVTRGAVGNLINKYRAVLRKCGLLNVFGSLAVAGALVLGGAGAVRAQDDAWAGKDVVISGDTMQKNGPLKADSLTILPGGALEYAGTSGGGEGQFFIKDGLTIKDGGKLTVNKASHAGIQGAASHQDLVDSGYTATFDMSGEGSHLTITDSQVQMKEVNISGGIADISGWAVESGSAWDQGAMLGANGGAFSLNGGVVNLNNSAQLFAPTYNLRGGAINMHGGDDGPALVRGYGADGSLNLDGAIIGVHGKGVLSAPTMNITGGTLSVVENAELTMGIAGLEKGISLTEALKKSSEAVVNQTGGSVDVAGRLDLGGTLNITGGEFTVRRPGSVRVMEGNTGYPTTAWGKTSAINMQGGTLNVHGYAEAAQLSISGGTTNIIGGDPAKTWDQQGLGGYNEIWDADAKAWADANAPTTVSGAGTVVNIRNANLFGGVATEGAAGGLRITDGAAVNLFGTGDAAGMLFASNGQELTITRDASVNVADGQNGVFNARTVRVDNGATVSTGGGLLMVSGLPKGKTITEGKAMDTVAAAEAVVGNGGTLAVTGAGHVDLNNKSSLTFENGSTFDVSAASVSNGNAAIRNAADNAVRVADNAKLRITDAKAGDRYSLVDNANGILLTGNGTGWTGANFMTDTSLLNLTSNGDGTFSAGVASAEAAFPGLNSGLGGLVSNLYADRGNDVNAQKAGARFLSRTTNNRYIADAGQAVTTMESAARMGLLLAPQMTWAAHNAAGTAVTQRTTLAQPRGNGLQSMNGNFRHGFDMWVMPLYQNWNANGLSNGSRDLDIDADMGGVALGADYTFANNFRAGLAFNIGGGHANGTGDINDTDNDFNFWGLGIYAGWMRNNFGLTADVNYTGVRNELEQDLPTFMGMSNLKSDIDSWALSAGLRGEYRLETGVLDIIPHVGVRYTNLNTESYDVTSGGTVLKGDSVHQNIWTFPIGVALSKDIATESGWSVRPSLDMAVIPAAGDIKAEGDVYFTGVNGKAEMKTQVLDHVTYMGQAGLEFGKDNISFGLNYNLQAGKRTTAHGVFGTFRYEF